MDDVTFGHNGLYATKWRLNYHEQRCDTGVESHIYECLFLYCIVLFCTVVPWPGVEPYMSL